MNETRTRVSLSEGHWRKVETALFRYQDTLEPYSQEWRDVINIWGEVNRAIVRHEKGQNNEN